LGGIGEERPLCKSEHKEQREIQTQVKVVQEFQSGHAVELDMQ
jgi:hypothetical protein